MNVRYPHFLDRTPISSIHLLLGGDQQCNGDRQLSEKLFLVNISQFGGLIMVQLPSAGQVDITGPVFRMVGIRGVQPCLSTTGFQQCIEIIMRVFNSSHGHETICMVYGYFVMYITSYVYVCMYATHIFSIVPLFRQSIYYLAVINSVMETVSYQNNYFS